MQSAQSNLPELCLTPIKVKHSHSYDSDGEISSPFLKSKMSSPSTVDSFMPTPRKACSISTEEVEE